MKMEILKRIKDVLTNYFENSSIHGFKYIPEDGRHWGERLFWLFSISLSFYGLYYVLYEYSDTYQNRPVEFATDTNYLQWNTTFPAVTICPYVDDAMISGIIDHNNVSRKDALELILDMLTRPNFCISCEKCADKHLCDMNFENALENFPTCDATFRKCSWNGVPFDCCSNFQPLRTEFSPCYTINSVHARPAGDGKKVVSLISNMDLGAGSLDIELRKGVLMQIHSSNEVPFRYFDEFIELKDGKGTHSHYHYRVLEIENDPHLRELSVTRRRCRFTDEPIPHSYYKHYSYSACVVECRLQKQLELCNCTHIYMPRLDHVPVCGVRGHSCLFKNSLYLYHTTPYFVENDPNLSGLQCDCYIGCAEMDLEIVSMTIERFLDSQAPSTITINLSALPTERHMRNVIRTNLDLVLSIGGSVSLFIGASIISVFELIMFVLVRPCPCGQPGREKHVEPQDKHTNTTIPNMIN